MGFVSTEGPIRHEILSACLNSNLSVLHIDRLPRGERRGKVVPKIVLSCPRLRRLSLRESIVEVGERRSDQIETSGWMDLNQMISKLEYLCYVAFRGDFYEDECVEAEDFKWRFNFFLELWEDGRRKRVDLAAEMLVNTIRKHGFAEIYAISCVNRLFAFLPNTFVLSGLRFVRACHPVT
jgi:hypothetical protein